MSWSIPCPSSTLATLSSGVEFRCPKWQSPVNSGRRLQLLRAQSSPNSVTVRSTKHEHWAHEVELEVRDYELDQFGVVNNATYAQYCEHASISGLPKVGGLSANMIAESGCALAVAEMSIQYISQLKIHEGSFVGASQTVILFFEKDYIIESGDKFVVKVRVSGWSTTRLYLDHYIFKLPNQEHILIARATIVWLNKNYRPVRIPSEVIAKSIRLSNCGESV